MKLFIIGDGPEKENLQKQISTLDMEKQIRLCGRIDHDALPPYYHACDLFATASLSEMNSISMLEAMASGLYVLQRLDIYNRAQIVEGENGSLFETKEQFAALLDEESALSPDQRLRRKQTVTLSTKRYGQKEFLSAVLSVYDQALYKYNSSKKQKKFHFLSNEK